MSRKLARYARRTIASFAKKSFAEIAVEVIHPFMAGEISRAELARMAEEAYAALNIPK